MKIMILHLSDLHIDLNGDGFLEKKASIVNIVKNLEYELDRAFIVVTGDISSSGEEGQIESGFEFAHGLMKMFEAELLSSNRNEQVKTNLIIIPGNHDCSLPENDMVRKILVDGILKDVNTANNNSVIDQCLKAQEDFFEYRDIYAEEGLINNDKIYYEYKFSHNSENIYFKCLNTAWMSQRKEQQAEIVYPISRIDGSKGDETLVITLFHHPYPWFEAENGRELRKKIEHLSDIILTGHEHDSTFRKQETSGGERNTYIEGGVFQKSGKNDSDFNVLIIDTEAKKQKFLHASWADTRYEPAQGTVCSDDRNLLWHEYQVSSLRSQEMFTPNEKTMSFLGDPGAYFSKKNTVLTLSDIYVAPDLRTVPTKISGEVKQINGDNLISFVKENKHLLVVGDYQSGKTALCKHLFILFTIEFSCFQAA